MILNPYFALAQAAQGQAENSGWQIVVVFVIPIALVWLVMYMVALRPQRKREAERKSLLADLKKNDRVLTSGGIFGTIAAVRDFDVILKVDDGNNTRIRVIRTAIVDVEKASREEKDSTGLEMKEG